MAKLDLPKKRTMLIESSFIQRTIAFFLDIVLIHLIIITPFSGIVQKLIPASSVKESYALLSAYEGGTLTTIAIFITLMIYLYFTFTEYITGQSVGKKILGLYVVSEKNRLSLLDVMLRSLAVLPLFPFIIFWLLDPLFMMFSRTQQRLSDILMKTKVMQVQQV